MWKEWMEGFMNSTEKQPEHAEESNGLRECDSQYLVLIVVFF